MNDLKSKTIRGSMFTGTSTMIIRLLRIVTTVILARILDPADFGSIALAMLLVSSCYLFVDFGMGPALIHTSADKGRAAYQAFIVTVVIGTVLFLLTFTYAEPIARFLGDLSITSILRWMAVLILLEALVTIPDALLRKDLHFGRLSVFATIPEVAYMGIVVAFAFAGLGVWSIVYARIISATLKTVLIWVACPGWVWLVPRPWDWSLMRNLINYGGKSTTNGLIAYFHSNWDDWLVGRVLGTTALGFYSKAYDLSNQTLASLSRSMINGVFFPSYAKIKNDTRRLTRAYMKSLRFVLMLMFPMALGMLVVAPELVPIVFGEKWIPMILTLQIYSVLVLTRPISSNTYPLFMALGLPGYNVRAGLLLSVVMVPLALLFLNSGIEGVAAAVVIAHFVGATYNIYQVNTVLPETAYLTVRVMVPPWTASILMMIAVQVSKAPLADWAGGEQNVVSLVVMILIGCVVYAVTSFFTQRALILEITHALLSASGIRKSVVRSVA